ncbi:hypothetical protein QM312_35960, partial [Burkholderia cenocepacia]|uniref:hypothetical protein n=1 Tax=Burkholderia cenocepacia TaxID=95486 RepID=UPI0024B7BBF5
MTDATHDTHDGADDDAAPSCVSCVASVMWPALPDDVVSCLCRAVSGRASHVRRRAVERRA